MDNIEADINFIDKAKKVIENIEFPSLDKKEGNRRNLYPDRINSSVRKK
ncbi:hypothetical protein [Brachyspira hyodysenteriae]|nr:hypothetical protein [Brachyspira hyodysenteriae]